jgi:predicted Rossmann fold flavoprotein
MAAIWAGRTAAGRRILVVDGARKLGAKILIAGGGRCNVTHDRVDASDYAGSSRHAIRKVLGQFDERRTVAFFEELGVALKREPTGKLFPATDRAQSVLEALLRGARGAGATIVHPRRVETVSRGPGGFVVAGAWGRIDTPRVVLATGGMSVPKTGSDGQGYALARALGHTVTPTFPALVPLTLPQDHFVTTLSGITTDATLEVVSATGRRLASFTGSTLLTHFGLSGPAVLDISRHFIEATASDRETRLVINWLSRTASDTVERELVALGPRRVSSFLSRHLPDRLAEALLDAAEVDRTTPGHRLRREDRRRLASLLTRMPLPVTGHRGFPHAEATAGGVPLREIRLRTMESRTSPGLHLCGEICDVDGRVGGFNFQWAWASGYTAGTAAGTATLPPQARA